MTLLTLELKRRRQNRPTRWELKGKPVEPCPFCGSDAIAVVDDEIDGLAWCCCCKCGAEGPARPDRYNAIQMWQRRSLTTGAKTPNL